MECQSDHRLIDGDCVGLEEGKIMTEPTWRSPAIEFITTSDDLSENLATQSTHVNEPTQRKKSSVPKRKPSF